MLDSAPPEAIAHLLQEGWCVVPNVLTREQSAQALERLWAAAEESRRRGVDTFMPILDPNERNIRVFNLLDIDPVFRELIRHPVALSLVRALLGDPFQISNFTANIARPGSKSMGVHSDQALVIPAPWAHAWALNIIWCLTDVTAENGGTLYLPGSHRIVEPSQVPADAYQRMVPFEAPAGSIVAMEGRIWHTSGVNRTRDQDRALLFGYYSKPFIRAQVNHNMTLRPEVQAQLDPQMREWLALTPNANTEIAADLLSVFPQ